MLADEIRGEYPVKDPGYFPRFAMTLSNGYSAWVVPLGLARNVSAEFRSARLL